MKMKVMMKMMTISIFMLLVSCVVNVNVIHGIDVNVDSVPPPSAAVRLELIHRDSPKLHRENDETQSHHHHDQRQRWKELHRRDSLRHHNLLYSRRRRDQEKESDSFQMPMNSGADYRNGEYFVHVNVGTPAQKVTLVADTASDLTWVNCKHGCGRNCSISKGKLSSKRVFRADHSSTFQVIPCSSQMCKSDLSDLFSLHRCPSPFTPCSYDYRYMEGSAAIGFFANETISVGLTNCSKKGKLENVLIGCTKSIEDMGSVKGADGILGLGYGNYTFTMKAAAEFGGKFSYCLVDHLSHENVSNYLTFGDTNGSENTLGSSKRYTKLLLGGKLRSFYGLNVLGISIGGILLKIPSFVWDENRGGGTILDSGTSLTYLALPAYEPVMDALEKSLSKYERFPADQEGPFEFCFNSTGFDEASVPRLAIHFEDGARFEPPMKSYIIDVADQEKCIGFVPAIWPANSIIGNIMQQNHLWEFDLVGRTLGFASSSCT